MQVELLHWVAIASDGKAITVRVNRLGASHKQPFDFSGKDEH